MHILLTNDDGIEAPGLVALARRLKALGRVSIVAPVRERSGIAHAITVHGPMHCQRLPDDGACQRYGIEGTPVDCVKLAVSTLVGRDIDLVLSGINPGENAGVSALYSGTVAAALEAALYGLPAAAISLANDYGRHPVVSLDRAAEVAVGLVEELLRRGMLGPAALNVNLPLQRDGWPLGWRVTRQSVTPYDDQYATTETANAWRIVNVDSRDETDVESDLYHLRRGYVTVTPLSFDRTDREALAALKRAAEALQEEA